MALTLFGPVRRDVERTRATAAASTHDPRSRLFAEQLLVVNDTAQFKALLCGRRGGKTECAIDDLAAGMLTDCGGLNLYCALTMSSARDIFWGPFKAANELHGWGFEFDHTRLDITHPNGSKLLVRGMDDIRDIEKRRGVGFRRIRIDECGAQKPSILRYFVEEVLEATLMDSSGSDLWLMGTPNPQAFGMFYDVTTGVAPGWSVHHWTAKQNPHVDFERFVNDPLTGLLKRRNWTADNSIFRREYLAEWTLESSRMVYRFERDRNVVARLPQLVPDDEWIYGLGIDFGVGHKTACAVLAWPKRFGRDAYVVKCEGKVGLAPSDACTWIYDEFISVFNPLVTVGDVGGMGKAYWAEWNKRFPNVPMRAAEKQHKRAALEFTSDALHTAVPIGNYTDRRGLMSLAGNDELHRQWATLQWDEDRGDIAPGQDDDESHAAMYIFRESPAFTNPTTVALPPTPITNTTHEFRKPKGAVPEQYAGLAHGWKRRR